MGHLTDSRHSPNKMAVCSVSSGTVGPGWISELYQSQITDCAALQKAVMAQLSTSPAFLGTAALFRCVCISLVRPVTHSLTLSVCHTFVMSAYLPPCYYATQLLCLCLPLCYSVSVCHSATLPLCYTASLLLCPYLPLYYSDFVCLTAV